MRDHTAGSRDHPISPRSPLQNGYSERIIGSIRRECLDRASISGASHLHRTLRSYARYYNWARTHLSLAKDSPVHRTVQHRGDVVALP
ncbi:MAG: transposase [Alphaproteobacteria bacterium]|nr:transposase [Alphaproteobacteria bacterium]